MDYIKQFFIKENPKCKMDFLKCKKCNTLMTKSQEFYVCEQKCAKLKNSDFVEEYEKIFKRIKEAPEMLKKAGIDVLEGFIDSIEQEISEESPLRILLRITLLENLSKSKDTLKFQQKFAELKNTLIITPFAEFYDPLTTLLKNIIINFQRPLSEEEADCLTLLGLNSQIVLNMISITFGG